MENTFHLLDVVALLTDIPERGLHRGHVGTIVEVLDPDLYYVEFCDDQGRTYAMQALHANQMLPLLFQASEKVA